MKEESIKNKLEVNISFLKASIFSLYFLFFFFFLFLNISTKIHFLANSFFSNVIITKKVERNKRGVFDKDPISTPCHVVCVTHVCWVKLKDSSIMA